MLLEAKKDGVISELRPYLNKIQETNFRISLTLINRILDVARES